MRIDNYFKIQQWKMVDSLSRNDNLFTFLKGKRMTVAVIISLKIKPGKKDEVIDYMNDILVASP